MSIQPHNLKAASSWSGGGEAYERVSLHLDDAIARAVEALRAGRGERALDVATGTGRAARRLAAQGARAAGIDLGEELIAAARKFAAAEGVDVDFRVGDAEALPFGAGDFDLAVSTFGVMFATRPEAAAAELARVLRPGGRLALTSWPPDGSVAAKFRMTAPYLPASSAPSPFDWGREARVRELLGEAFDLRFERGVTTLRLPDPGAAWELFVGGYGPTRTLVASLPPERREAYRRDFTAFHEGFRTGRGVEMPRDYLLTVGVRRPPP